MVGNDPVGRWDWRGTEESGKKGSKSCKCCCVEDIDMRSFDLHDPSLHNTQPRWKYAMGDVILFDVTLSTKNVDSKGKSKKCTWKWGEKSNQDMQGDYKASKEYKDRTDYATNTVHADFGWNEYYNQNGKKIESAFRDVSYMNTETDYQKTRDKFWTLYIKLTVFSSSDKVCQEKCGRKSLTIEVERKIDWSTGKHVKTPPVVIKKY
jgi:hypothetical protein